MYKASEALREYYDIWLSIKQLQIANQSNQETDTPPRQKASKCTKKSIIFAYITFLYITYGVTIIVYTTNFLQTSEDYCSIIQESNYGNLFNHNN